MPKHNQYYDFRYISAYQRRRMEKLEDDLYKPLDNLKNYILNNLPHGDVTQNVIKTIDEIIPRLNCSILFYMKQSKFPRYVVEKPKTFDISADEKI